MRGLLGGLVGAAASAAAWLAIEHSQQASYGWMVCLIGLITGICVHKASEPGSGGFTRGALAIILTLAAIVGGQKAYALYMQASSTGAQPAVVAKASADDDDEDADEGVQAPATDVVLPEVASQPEGLGKQNYTKTALKKNMSDQDMLWICVAALAAYLTGKGGDKAPVEASGESEKAPEPQGTPENEAE